MSPIFITQFMQINGNIQGITFMKLVIGCAEIEQRKLFLIAAHRYPLNQQDKIKICGYRSDTTLLSKKVSSVPQWDSQSRGS